MSYMKRWWAENDTHMETWNTENSRTDWSWIKWITDVETLIGHSADGDQATDGYSLDNFYGMWEAGWTPMKAALNRSYVIR